MPPNATLFPSDAEMLACAYALLMGSCFRRAQKKQDSFYAVCLKLRAIPHSLERDKLKNGYWCIEFSGCPAVPEDGVPVDAAVTILLHIGSMRLSPWRASWSRHSYAPNPVGEPLNDATRIYTKASS